MSSYIFQYRKIQKKKIVLLEDIAAYPTSTLRLHCTLYVATEER